MRNGTEHHKICKSAVLSIFAISKSRLERVASHLKTSCTAPLDRRGTHGNRPNKLENAVLMQIAEHIKSFPKYTSHYSRKDNIKHEYLSPNLNAAKMHKMYLEKYEPEQYALLQKNEAINPKVKYDFYRKYFAENFRLSFGKPRTDTCSKCDRLAKKLESADNEAERNALNSEKSLHLKKAETFYEDLREKTKLASEDPTVEVLSFDFQQNMPLPVSPSSDVFYKIQMWVYNFCIYVGSSKTSYFYVYDETVCGKGQNEVVSFLHHFFNNFMRPEVKTLHLFSDNCSSQNKNHVLVQFLFTCIWHKKFEYIVHRYPEPGHSFLPCDRSFGAIELKKRSHDRIFLPKEYHKIILESGKKFKLVEVTQDFILNFKDHFAPHFRKVISTKKCQFKISKYKLIKYDVTEMPKILCSESVRMTTFTDFIILKKNADPSMPTDALYCKPRLLKPLKFKHVMEIAEEYVPKHDMWFYDAIREAQGDKDTELQNIESDHSEYDDLE